MTKRDVMWGTGKRLPLTTPLFRPPWGTEDGLTVRGWARSTHGPAAGPRP